MQPPFQNQICETHGWLFLQMTQQIKGEMQLSRRIRVPSAPGLLLNMTAGMPKNQQCQPTPVSLR